MKKFIVGLIAGIILTTSAMAFADQPIHLIVNGAEISFPDAPPQLINDRVMVPARPLAEALGATVEWDGGTSSVIVTSQEVNIKTVEPTIQTTNIEQEVIQQMPTSNNQTLKVNGNDLNRPFWVDSEGQPIISAGDFGHRVLPLVLTVEEYSYVPQTGEVLINNNPLFALETTIKDNAYCVVLRSAKDKGLLNYTWNPDTGELLVSAP